MDTVEQPLEIRMLGPFDVRVEGQPLPRLRTQKGRWLLAILALRSPRPVERSWHAGTLWPDSSDDKALFNLRHALVDLRRSLGSAAERLNSPSKHMLALELLDGECDLQQFDSLISVGDSASLYKAVELYRGPLLEGCAEEWVFADRSNREQSFLNALDVIARIESESGRFRVAADLLKRAVAVDPLRESAQRGLMCALASSGDYAAAAQVYRDLRRALQDQVGTNPAGETTALYEEIRARARCPATDGNNLDSQDHRHVFRQAEFSSDGGRRPAVSMLHNLPPSLTSFIGRAEERREVKRLLTETRLLTLTGTGGSGKTRLLVEVARECIADYPDGVWLVELASLSDPSLVVHAAAAALNVREQAGTPLSQSVLHAISARNMLILLDNCEHLLGACAELAASVLRSCPAASIMATSRERLGIAGEYAYRVPSLSLPVLDDPISPESLNGCEAVQLFEARARRVRSEFRITQQNAPSVAGVCLRLDGIPLAIELAAARVRSLSVGELHRRLDECFDLLTGGDRAALPRQQTLRGLIDWSYDLLSPMEQRLLRWLSVFAGGWTLAEAETVCAGVVTVGSGSAGVLNTLAGLVDKSLVIVEEADGSVRYRFLEIVRQYARYRLAESGEVNAARESHLAYFAEFAEEAEPHLHGEEQGEWLQRLETDHDNLRAALSWSLSNADSDRLLRLCGALSRFWWTRGHLTEGREWCARALGRLGKHEQSPHHAKALIGAGGLAYFQGDYSSAHNYYRESLAIYDRTGDRAGTANTLNCLGNVAWNRGDAKSALDSYKKGLALFREEQNSSGIAFALHGLGLASKALGEFAAAEAHLEESLTIFMEIGNLSGVAYTLQGLGLTAKDRGDIARAEQRYQECLHIFRDIGDRRGIAFSLHGLGLTANERNDFPAARSILEDALAIFREIENLSGIAYSLHGLATVACSRHESDSAIKFFEESLAIHRKLEDREGIALCLFGLGEAAYQQNVRQSALASFSAALAIHAGMGDKLRTVESLEAIGNVAAADGQIARAMNLWDAAGQVRDTIGIPLPARQGSVREQYRSAAPRTEQGAAPSKSETGSCFLTIDEAVKFALAD